MFRTSSRSLKVRGRLPAPVLVWMAFVFALWFICLGLMGFWRKILHLPYPYNFPFFPVDHLYDIWCLTPRFHHVHSRDFFSAAYGYPYQYPAPSGIFYLWEIAFGHPFFSFFATSVVGLFAVGFLFRKHLRRAGVPNSLAVLVLVYVALSSYVLWYEGIQANIEIFLFFEVIGGIIALLNRRYNAAAVLFGLAGAMKIFPLALLGLFVPLRRWRELLLGLTAALMSNIAGLWMLCPDLRYSYQKISEGLALQRDHITLYFDDKAIGFDHSIFSFIKIGWKYHFRSLHDDYLPVWMFKAYFLTVVVLGTSLWIWKIRKLPLLNQIACLLLCAILLPPTSYEYTILHMYIPFLLLLVLTFEKFKNREDTSSLRPFFLAFALLFSPLSEVIARGINFGGTLKCLVLIYLLQAFLRNPLPGLEDIWRKSTTTYM